MAYTHNLPSTQTLHFPAFTGRARRIAVLKAFLDERARRIQAVARGRRARKEAVLRLPKLSAVIDAAVEAEAERQAVEAEAEAGSGAYDDDVRARLERIEQELRR
eukprot:4823385-Pleurochrysis_carterae.AAC.2